MANHAYLSVRCRDYSEATMLDYYEKFLATASFSAERPGFTALVLRAVGPEQATLAEYALRATPADAAAMVGLVREHVNADLACEATAHWDLWAYDAESRSWQLRPQRLELGCLGLEYDDQAWRQLGHFYADLGFEHFFTGHARLLGAGPQQAAAPADAAEEEFLAAMAQPERLREYQAKTRENIRRLLDWMGAVEGALPVERCQLWSEGEEDFEARLDEILAVR